MEFNYFEPSDNRSRAPSTNPQGRAPASHPNALPPAGSGSIARSIESNSDSIYEQSVNDFNGGLTEDLQFRLSPTPHSFTSSPPLISLNAPSTAPYSRPIVQTGLFNDNQFLPFGNDNFAPMQSTAGTLDSTLAYSYDHQVTPQGFSSNSWANSPSYSSPSHSPAATAFSPRHSFDASSDGHAYNQTLRPTRRQPQTWDETIARSANSRSSSTHRLSAPPSGNIPNGRRKMVHDLHICYRSLDLPKPLLKPRPRRRRGSGRRGKAAARQTISQPSTPSADEAHAGSPGYDNDGKETERGSPCESQGSQSDQQVDNAPWFACPYVKRDHPSLEKGCWVKLKSVAYVKQHLRANHSSPKQCLDGLHSTNKDFECLRCGLNPSSSISHDDKNSPIHQRGNKNTTHEAQWERVYSSLFPDETNIPSPYLDPTLTLWMRHLIDFLEKHGRKRLSVTYASLPEEQFQAAFRMWVMEAFNQYTPEEVRESEMLLRWMDMFYGTSPRDAADVTSKSTPVLPSQDLNILFPNMNMQQPQNIGFRSPHVLASNAPAEVSGFVEQGGGSYPPVSGAQFMAMGAGFVTDEDPLSSDAPWRFIG